MNTTVYGPVALGRIDVNPKDVPTSKLTASNRDFEERLEAAQKEAPDAAPVADAAQRVDSRNPEVADAETPATSATDNAADSDGSGDPTATKSGPETGTVSGKQEELPSEVDNSGEPANLLTTGQATKQQSAVQANGAAAANSVPTASQTVGLDPTNGTGSQQGTAAGQVPLTAATAASAQSGSNTNSRVDAAATGNRGHTDAGKSVKVNKATPSFRTSSPSLIQAAERIRESIFKQIAFHLSPTGGELRMRLDPPDLGGLQVQMVVERGAVTQLYLSAERQEVLSTIDKHLQELMGSLEQQGLDVTDADVQTSLMKKQEQRSWNEAADNGDGEQDESETPNQLRPGQGFITADGPRLLGLVTNNIMNELAQIALNSGSSVLSTKQAAFGDNPFLSLLVTQMRSQTPLDPVDNNSFMQQVATFSSMEEQKELNDNMLRLLDFQGVLARLQGLSEGSSLLGKSVTWKDGQGHDHTGVVDSVFVNENGEVLLKVGDQTVGMHVVTGIAEPTEQTESKDKQESKDDTQDDAQKDKAKN